MMHSKVFLDRKLHELDPVELAILRISTYELVFRKEIPYRVVINEALSLTKKFGADGAYKYVNAVLDKVAKATREQEFEE